MHRTPDELAEIEHAEALHFEDAFFTALELAERFQRAGAGRPQLEGEHDGCLLPVRSYTFLAQDTDDRGAMRITVTLAGGGQFAATVAERYTHALGDPDGTFYDGAYHVDEASALVAGEERSRERRTMTAVWRLDDRWMPVALCYDGLIYRPA